MTDEDLTLVSILVPLHAHDDGQVRFSDGCSVSFRTHVSTFGRHVRFPEGYSSPERERIVAAWMDRHAPGVGVEGEHEAMRALAEAKAKAMYPIRGEDPSHD